MNPKTGEKVAGPSERRVLIDEWFPIEGVGVEGVRERSTSQVPGATTLHVWFARRPLTTSRAAILASLLPPSADRRKLLRALGIPPDKDVVGAATRLEKLKAEGKKAKNPFTWERAFKHTPSEDDLIWLKSNLRELWGTDTPIVVDPMAGGGSIPYEAVRLGLPTIAGELNPVAFICLKGTVEYPAKFGKKLVQAVKDLCMKVHESASKELQEFFPKSENEEVYAYLWARTIKCSACGLIIPMSPNWWIVQESGPEGIAVRPTPPKTGDLCGFEIIKNPLKHGFDPSEGTDVGKAAKCPRCKTVTPSDQVKIEAQAGRMGHQLYAVCTKRLIGRRKKSWHFRTPVPEEIEAVKKAEEKLKEKLSLWEYKGLVPAEDFPRNASDKRPLQYGMKKWCDMFNSRQLLTHLIYLEKFLEQKKKLLNSAQNAGEREFAKAVIIYGAMVFDRCVDNNCLLSIWNVNRTAVAHAMGLQGFPFKSSYAEWDHSKMLWPWALSKVLDALNGLVKLLPERPKSPTIYFGDAASIPLKDKSVDCIVVDPPYYENVMYGEVSDFFYVWLKRMLGDIFPEAFATELTDKSEEAVANPAVFREVGKGNAKVLADQHYRSKMEACFKDMNRVLKDDGVLTVMFTHRRAEAWAGLASALINAGFTFRASWPVFTEPAGKFGKHGKGVLKVTVLLACRKRLAQKKGLWEEVRKELYQEAEKKVKEHSEKGISGPDLIVSVYGPVLGRFADYSIVKDATGNIKTPKDALEIVAEVVNKFLTADVSGVDLETLAYLNLIRNFPHFEVDYDLARISTVFGGNISLEMLDIKGGSGLVEKKGEKVRVLTSKERVKKGIIHPAKADTLRTLIDIVHASLISYEQLGMESVKRLLRETGRDTSDSGFLAVLKAITQAGMNVDVAKELNSEAKTARALLEALGHEPDVTLKKGERIFDYF